MKKKNDALDEAEKVLFAAHRNQPTLELSSNFTEKVMRQVRAIGPISPREAVWKLFENIVWQAVPISATCALALFCYAAVYGKSPTSVLAEAMFYGEMKGSVVGI